MRESLTRAGLAVFLSFSVLVAPLAPAIGQAASPAGPVDLELVLAVDASGSIDEDEFRLQRRGWAEAITHPRVVGAIRSGGQGAIAVMYLEWAAIGCENVAVKWARISDAVTAQRFATAITTAKRLDCWGGNAIGDAVFFATKSILTNRFDAKRKVIDVSGDGPNTLGSPVELARERAVALGITINGLVIMDPGRFFYAPGGGTLEDYYRNAVAGGTGSFVMVAKGRKNFRQAALAKLVREIAARPDAGPVRGKTVAVLKDGSEAEAVGRER